MKNYLAKIWRFSDLSKNFQLSLMRIFQDQFLIGVTGIIFNEKREVLLVKHTYRQTPWSLPGGYIKGKEHPTEGLEREIEEETGFIVSADYQLNVKTDRETARLDICFVGKHMGGEFKSSKEVSEASYFSFDSLPDISTNHLFLINEALRQVKFQP